MTTQIQIALDALKEVDAAISAFLKDGETRRFSVLAPLVQDNIAALEAMQESEQEPIAWRDAKYSHPTSANEVAIKLVDGSVLHNAIWQLDGDWYWKSAGSEMFISEYRVTHWIYMSALYAAPPAPAKPEVVAWMWKSHGWAITTNGKHRAIKTSVDVFQPPVSTQESDDFIELIPLCRLDTPAVRTGTDRTTSGAIGQP